MGAVEAFDSSRRRGGPRVTVQGRPPTCGLCGRMLDTSFHFVCHVCGAAYCYVHMPERCCHRKVGGASIHLIGETLS